MNMDIDIENTVELLKRKAEMEDLCKEQRSIQIKKERVE
jgi:hypothetical protein